MLTMFLDMRPLVILFLIVAVIALALGGGFGLVEPHANGHPAGQVLHPRNDCGDNFFKIFITPRGDECFVKGVSENTVDELIERSAPGMKDEEIGVFMERYEEALNYALRRLGMK